MNIYFLLEDSKSAFYVWSEWLREMLPNFTQAFQLNDIKDYQYCIESGYGYPAIKKYFIDSLKLIQTKKIKLDYFVLVYDSDDRNDIEIENEKTELKKLFNAAKISAKFEIIVMKKCFETWLIGNRNVYPYNNDNFHKYEQFYNASILNPEDMGYPINESSSVGNYHYRYFQEMLKCSVHKNYSKKRPGYAYNRFFLDGMIDRISTSEDLKSFREFVNIVEQVKATC